jgi:RNA polymerase sigma factor (sigma-70 family)
LALRIKAGDQAAREALIVANLRLVMRIASAYKSRGATVDDLIQEGNRGLMRAAESYDPQTHNCRFASYATFWIRCMIQRALTANFSLIRVPDYIFRLRSRLGKVASEVLGGAPGAIDLARDIPVSPEIAARMRVSSRRLGHIRRSFTECWSYHAGDGESGEDGAVLGARAVADRYRPDLNLERVEAIAALYRALNHLTPFESWLIRHRFGLDKAQVELAEDHVVSPRRRGGRQAAPSTGGGSGAVGAPSQAGDHAAPGTPRRASYVAIARAFGIPTTRVRQIERDALRKLRAQLEGSFAGETSGPVVCSASVSLSD